MLGVFGKQEKKRKHSRSEDVTVTTPMELWEPDYSCVLWRRDVVQHLQTPPVLMEENDVFIKSSIVDGNEYRTLTFAHSTEVQGSVRFDKGAPNFGHVVLEYTQAMCNAMLRVPDISCDSKGRVLSLGLGAGTMANFAHTMLKNYEVDVIEISPTVLKAARAHLGTPPEGTPRFNVFLNDAVNVWESVGDDKRYEIIFLDAYIPGPYVPASLLTESYIRSLRDHLAPNGVVIFNFCLPAYNEAAQHSVLRVWRSLFKHMWLHEATASSKILVAHNFDIQQSPELELALWRNKTQEFRDTCNWRVPGRALGYTIYLPQENAKWEAQWSRVLHEEASRHWCSQGRLEKQFCSWFMPRDRIYQAFTDFDRGEVDKVLREVNWDYSAATKKLKDKRESLLNQQ